jgi:hypothetical protein
VLLDDDGQPIEVAASKAGVLSRAAVLVDLGVPFTVEPIGNRCRDCGALPTDQHEPNICPKGA